MNQSRFSIIRDATKVVLRHVDNLPHSERRERLLETIRECTREAEPWRFSPPSRRDMDALMARLLAVYIEATNLELGRDAAEGGGLVA